LAHAIGALTSLDAKMPREPLDLSESLVATINDVVQMIRAGSEVLSGLAGHVAAPAAVESHQCSPSRD
jgi:hypothetical protein